MTFSTDMHQRLLIDTAVLEDSAITRSSAHIVIMFVGFPK